MVWQASKPNPDDSFRASQLGGEHVEQMLGLVAATHSGPFGPRTIELGDYLGCFEGPRLIAMAGERLSAGGLREISGVCPHPDFQGRGHARRLMETLIGRALRRHETPFLHVVHGNANARRLYERMGFRRHQETVIRVMSPI